MNAINKTYERENIIINYPYIQEIDQKTNEKIKKLILEKINNYTSASINYDIKLLTDEIISIILYGTIEEKNYSDVLNFNIKEDNTINPSDIFTNKNEPVIILKSKYANEYLEKKYEIIKSNYIDSKSYTEILEDKNINIYFTKEKIGIILCNLKKIIGDYYINVEIEYEDLNNTFIEKEINNLEITEEIISKFLTEGLITETNKIDEINPSGYIFTENGNFIYNAGEKNQTSENELMSYRGTWKIEEKKIKLNVLEEKRKMQYIPETNYEIIATNYEIEYNIDNYYESYIVTNNYDTILYKNKLDKTYIETQKNIADNG